MQRFEHSPTENEVGAFFHPNVHLIRNVLCDEIMAHISSTTGLKKSILLFIEKTFNMKVLRSL